MGPLKEIWLIRIEIELDLLKEMMLIRIEIVFGFLKETRLMQSWEIKSVLS